MRATTTIAFASISILAAAAPAAAQETPFAAPPLAPIGRPDSAVSSLSDIMGKVQMRHIKLWYALKSRNWDLVGYELGHLRDTFETAVILYQGIPIELITTANTPLVTLQAATKVRDASAAEQSFAALTAACNTCHEAAGIGFVLIRTPTASPFSNQSFAPDKK